MLPAITAESIRQLAGFDGGGVPVTSCYLDVDGRRHVRHQDYEQELQLLLRRAASKAEGTASVADDFRRIESFVRGGIDRSNVRGLAMFSCSAADFFEVVSLPVSVRSQVVVNPLPAVRQLERVITEYERIGVLLVDRQRTRLFAFELGELVDHTETVEALPRGYDTRGERERGGPEHHVDELAAQHVRHAADAAWGLHATHPFAHLTIGAPDSLVGELERALHPYLRERLCDRIHVAVTAPDREIRSAALALESRVGREREQRLVDRLRGQVGRDQLAAAGLDAVLTALAQHRVDRLLVSAGFSQEGWQCDRCDSLAVLGRSCGVCGTAMVPVDDVVEEAVEVALAQGCGVDVCVGNADLDVLGRVGALLRF